jgi:hypothetical protein
MHMRATDSLSVKCMHSSCLSVVLIAKSYAYARNRQHERKIRVYTLSHSSFKYDKLHALYTKPSAILRMRCSCCCVGSHLTLLHYQKRASDHCYEAREYMHMYYYIIATYCCQQISTAIPLLHCSTDASAYTHFNCRLRSSCTVASTYSHTLRTRYQYR